MDGSRLNGRFQEKATDGYIADGLSIDLWNYYLKGWHGKKLLIVATFFYVYCAVVVLVGCYRFVLKQNCLFWIVFLVLDEKVARWKYIQHFTISSIVVLVLVKFL